MAAHVASLINVTVATVSISIVIFPMGNVTRYSFSLSVFSSTQNMVYAFGCYSNSVSVDTKTCVRLPHLRSASDRAPLLPVGD